MRAARACSTLPVPKQIAAAIAPSRLQTIPRAYGPTERPVRSDRDAGQEAMVVPLIGPYRAISYWLVISVVSGRITMITP
ncbi:hypothetical protein GCM10023195_22030 [Actinoallomurus liliacearum]|uniref:Uncharacterized protein n=1 Tax=Actinoallomurus liliacearum TaxID=1080073 RepID=A0ABP8THR6_9ACTN